MTECRTDLCNTVSITIQNIGTFSLQKGESVLSVLKDQKLLSFSHCGGNGTCGRCAVQFTKGAPIPQPGDRRRFTGQQLREGWRLACLARPVMDATLWFQPPKEKMTVVTENAFRLQNDVTSGGNGNYRESACVAEEKVVEKSVEERMTSDKIQMLCKGVTDEKRDTLVAIDLGTTTVVMQLIEAGSGRVIDTCRMMNPQRQFGADVISRMEKAMAGESAALTACIGSCLKNGMKKWLEAGFAPKLAVLAGNTVMIHLLLGQDVTNLAKAPFQPVTTAQQIWRNREVTTVIIPGISAFVGGDIMAGILACQEDMHREGIETALLVDLGTNGEMALLHQGKILCTATAAGPAFEGGVTANVPGADLIRIVAGLLRSGVVDETGLILREEMREGLSVDDVMIRQDDIRNLQMAKAAVFAGICVLLKESGLAADALQRVYLAGGFGYYLDVDAACAVGVLPMAMHDRVRSVGNAALAGATLYAESLYEESICKEMHGESCARSCLSVRAEQIRQHAQSINLAETQGFHERYIDAMYLKPYDV